MALLDDTGQAVLDFMKVGRLKSVTTVRNTVVTRLTIGEKGKGSKIPHHYPGIDHDHS